MTNLEQCQQFWLARRSIVLSTLSQTGESETSVTPFIRDEAGSLYIFISELAQHTQNLLSLMADKPTDLISGLLASDESETEQLFARERLTLQLAPTEIQRETAEYAVLIKQFEDEFGEVVAMLNSLPDFHLIQLKPVRGGYVIGFGKAFTFEGCPCNGLTPVTRK